MKWVLLSISFPYNQVNREDFNYTITIRIEFLALKQPRF